MIDQEPDYRFTLANERTFLAWIRTSMAFLAAGVAVRQLLPHFQIEGARAVLAIACIGMSALLAIGGYFRWRAVQLAMRADQPLPRSKFVPVLTIGLVITSLLCIVFVLW